MSRNINNRIKKNSLCIVHTYVLLINKLLENLEIFCTVLYVQFVTYSFFESSLRRGIKLKMNTVLYILFAFLVINQLLLPCLAFRSARGGGKHTNDKSVKENAPKTFTGISSGLPSQNNARKGLGLSAWGIIAVVITLILAGTSFYYFSMCYPILCKRERKYDMIGLPTVA